MAIQFARIELVGRAGGGNACCKGAYNARAIIKDQQTNVTYNFAKRGDNVHHEILLPDGVDLKFKSTKILMNEIERVERRKNSSLLKDIVIALPDDKELDLQDRINISRIIIDRMGWVKEGLGVQLDIHQPHDGEKNWHAHILLAKRRFAECGTKLGSKARDLDIQIRGGNNPFGIPEEQMIHEKVKDVINDYFKSLGLENRVDSIGINPQEHIGPVRMRSVLNQAADRNIERRIAEIEHLNNGVAVLNKVTRHMNVFSKADLMRAVKVMPNKEVQEKLVGDALAHKSVIKLFTTEGRKTQYYTTLEVRAEERKIERLAGYVANEKNVITLKGEKAIADVHRLIVNERATNDKFTAEQEKALSAILLKDQGIRVLRGRAGTGKSHTMGIFCSIAKSVGVNVIGVAPTHKARMELEKFGYSNNDTIKGLLFKYRNGRAFIPKEAVLVVDEAGMVGNDDYTELLKLAANRKCNVILAGDEKQLASIGRGGMFEVFAEKYGSSLISDIRRQNQTWAKSVAMALSNGQVRSGIEVLEEQGKIVRNSNAEESINALVQDWGKSSEKLEHRLIIAVKNADVDLINEAVRKSLIKQGLVNAKGFGIQGKTYAKGDRIIIKETSGDLGFTNGDFGIIEKLEKERCIIRLDGHGGEEGRKIEFDPRRYQGFRHGYATTVYKSQGASIFAVFILHNCFAGIRNSYVALSRCINDMRFYTNSEFTKNMEHLIKQLGHDAELGSSLSYMVKEEYKKAREDAEKSKTTFGKIGKWVRAKATEIGDRWGSNSEYYEYEAPVITHSKVEEVLEQVSVATVIEEAKANIAGEVAIAVEAENLGLRSVGMGRVENMTLSNKTSDTSKPTQKQRFYEQAERSRRSKESREQRDYAHEMATLKGAIEYNSDRIARDLLGEPNKKLSRGNVYRYGSRGSLAVHTKGEKAGTWFDFEAGKGGNIFALVQRERGGEFKDSAEYLKDMFGIAKARTLTLVHDNEIEDRYAKHVKAREQIAKEEELKAKAVEKLYSRAKEIKETSIANRYLREVRNIKLETHLGEDIKTAGIYHQNTAGEKGQYLAALVAFARDANGRVTGGQQILLNKKSANKADIDVQKKSFGKIAGSFVEVGNITNDHKAEKITIIAEGIETALSIRQAFEKRDINVKILCSFGVSNIRNYQAEEGEKIIIAADNDGKNAVSNKTIENTKKDLKEEKGAFVEIVRPDKEGDFNDVLKDQGVEKIQESFTKAIEKHQAKTVEEYFKAGEDESLEHVLDKQAISDLKYLEKYQIDQEQIVNGLRRSNLQGTIELDNTRKQVAIAEDMLENKESQGKAILKEVHSFGGKVNKREIVKSLTGKTEEEKLEHLWQLRDVAYIDHNILRFKSERAQVKNPQEAMKLLDKEQNFWLALESELKSKNIIKAQEWVGNSIAQAKVDQKADSVDQLYNVAKYAFKNKIIDEGHLVKELTLDKKLSEIHDHLTKTCYDHNCRVLTKHCNEIARGATIEHEGLKFDDVHVYLSHWKENVDHKLIPIKQINTEIRELQKQLEHDYGGPGL